MFATLERSSASMLNGLTTCPVFDPFMVLERQISRKPSYYRVQFKLVNELIDSCLIAAVKCNDSPLVLETLAGLGTGFDCASKVSKI